MCRTISANATGGTSRTGTREPGDITVHHARTIHGADGNASLTQRRRAISVRYCGDDVVYKFKRGAPRKPHHADVSEGDPVDHDQCPVVYRRSVAAEPHN